MYDPEERELEELSGCIGCLSLVVIIFGAAAIFAFVWWVGALVGWW